MSDTKDPQHDGIVGRGNREGSDLFRQWFAELNRTAEQGGQAAYVFVMGSINEILRTFNLPIAKVLDAVRAGNNDVGGRLVEMTGAEYMVRGRGYARSAADIGETVLARSDAGVPVRIRDIGQVTLGPDLRRGLADLDGLGDTVAGIVVMREGRVAEIMDTAGASQEQILRAAIPAGASA